MSKNNNRNNPPRKCVSEKQKRAIRRNYAIRAAKEKAGQTPAVNNRSNDRSKQAAPQPQRIEAAFPHFRYYRKSGHPALVVGEQTNEANIEEYRYRKVMHGDKDGKRTNEKVYPNPDPRDPDPMYIGKRVRHDDKNNFEPKPLPWRYPKKDK